MAALQPQFSIATRIPRPPAEVYAAVADPNQLCRYFTATATGPLVSGAKIEWSWADGEGELIYITSALPPQRIEFQWKAYKVDSRTRVVFDFEPIDGGTRIRVSESGWNPDDAGLRSSYEHCAGWQHMLLCLKAWLVHGIDLRP